VKDETLKSRLHRGRLILRDHLADFAGGLAHRWGQVLNPHFSRLTPASAVDRQPRQAVSFSERAPERSAGSTAPLAGAGGAL
jgi:hypothetical protein